MESPNVRLCPVLSKALNSGEDFFLAAHCERRIRSLEAGRGGGGEPDCLPSSFLVHKYGTHTPLPPPAAPLEFLPPSTCVHTHTQYERGSAFFWHNNSLRTHANTSELTTFRSLYNSIFTPAAPSSRARYCCSWRSWACRLCTWPTWRPASCTCSWSGTRKWRPAGGRRRRYKS